LNRFGEGHYDWTADPVTDANTALIRVTATSGAGAADTSDEAFSIANDGAAYYVNDGSDVGDEYTTAIGSDFNTGKTPDQPMANLASLLRVYDLDAGDTIYMDTGSYVLPTNVVVDASDSGVTIQGPTGGDHAAVLDRANFAAGSYVFDLAGADDVTLSHLTLRGGQYGVNAANNADVDGLRILLRGLPVRHEP